MGHLDVLEKHWITGEDKLHFYNDRQAVLFTYEQVSEGGGYIGDTEYYIITIQGKAVNARTFYNECFVKHNTLSELPFRVSRVIQQYILRSSNVYKN